MRILRLALILVLGLGAGVVTAGTGCTPSQVTLRGDWGEAAFSVEIADNDESRARGLMFRKSMPDFSGMLFVFDKPQRAQFWMKNTFIPLDMLFIDGSGVVRRIKQNATPHSTAIIDGGEGVKAVLEVNGGVVERLGITPGTQIQHPVFGPSAAWPCP